MNKLTNGQIKIRQIITANLDKFLSLEEMERDKKLALYNDIRKIFKLEPEIINDSVTGRFCGFEDISSYYETHLFETGQKRKVSSNFPEIQFHSFLYHQTYSDQCSSKLYLGGRKYGTTFWALFMLAQWQTVSLDKNAEITYYLKSGILTCSGSTHRILAHILWGEPRLKGGDSMTLIDELELDEDLNQSLLKLRNNKLVDYLVSKDQGYSIDEILSIKKLAYSTDFEQKIIAKYCSNRISKYSYRSHESNIQRIDEALNELQRVQKRNFLPRRISYLIQNTKFYRGSDFEYWFDRCYFKKPN